MIELGRLGPLVLLNCLKYVKSRVGSFQNALHIHCSKYLKEHQRSDNVNPCPIDKPYTSLDDKVESGNFAILAKRVKVLDQNSF